ncbi:MAG: hypothetical protein R2784_05135 [Saprospiraceae bacterium]
MLKVRGAARKCEAEEVSSKQLLEDGVISEQTYKRDLLTLEQRTTEFEMQSLFPIMP